jgi:hypothetical protein
MSKPPDPHAPAPGEDLAEHARRLDAMRAEVAKFEGIYGGNHWMFRCKDLIAAHDALSADDRRKARAWEELIAQANTGGVIVLDAGNHADAQLCPECRAKIERMLAE